MKIYFMWNKKKFIDKMREQQKQKRQQKTKIRG